MSPDNPTPDSPTSDVPGSDAPSAESPEQATESPEQATELPEQEAEGPGGHRAAGAGGLASRVPGGVPAIVAVVLLLIVAATGYLLFGRDGDNDPAASNCFVDTIHLTTAASLRPMVDQGVASIEDDDPCLDIEVSDGSTKDVLATLSDPNAKVPDLWIPDNPSWSSPLQKAGYQGTVVAESLAQSPVGLVSGPSISRPTSWFSSLQSGRLTTSDPDLDGASALALLAPFAESKQTGVSKAQVLEAYVPVAQSYGENLQAEKVASDPANVTATSTQQIPMTERDFIAARRTNSELTMVAPRTGVPVLRLPLLSVAKANLGALGKSNDGKGARAGRALAHWFASQEGRAAVVEGDFRVSGAGSGGVDVGLGNAKHLKPVRPQLAEEALRSWNTSAYPSSMLVLVDVSGSMNNVAKGGRSRIDLTAEAASVALDRLPDQARIGLWIFATDLGGKQTPYKELAGLKALDAKTGNMSHRQFLRAQLPTVLGSVRDAGTNLNDTVYAAYKYALKNYDDRWFNNVVVMTDGANDDSSSLSEAELIKSIEDIRDPVNKPVRIIPIGIGPDADMRPLQRIASATDSQAYLAEDPMNILLVLAQAVMSRG